MYPSLAALTHHLKAWLRGESFRGVLETPAANASVRGHLFVSGWIFVPGEQIVRLEATLGSAFLSSARYGVNRPDVGRVFPSFPESGASGFQLTTRLDPSLSGPQVLIVSALDSAGRLHSLTRVVDVRPAATHIQPVPAARFESQQPLPSASIVVPVHNAPRHTEACLLAVTATVPSQHPVEIIVVDDASDAETAVMLGGAARRDRRIVVVTNERNLGFGESCNRGAREARHETIVFLNSDTLPQPGWLPPLLASLQQTRVGAVGAKLVYPNATLQEAGGVVFRDGSAWNFGNGCDPGDPLFNYVREVDYCSAAALATWREPFLDAGGFDPRYAPAYYEDTDYCFALRARGRTIVYQPAAVLIHVEGASAGVDERAGVKRSQAANRVKFSDKWIEVLRDQPSRPSIPDRAALHRLAVRARSASRVLVCAPTLPEWDRESGSRRIFDFIAFLSERGCAVSFAAESLGGGARYIAALQQMGVAVYAGAGEDLIRHGGFDLALLHFWWIAELYLPVIRNLSPQTRILVDSVDLHFVRESRNPNREPGREGETKRELEAYAQADGVLTVSDREARLLAEAFNIHGHARVVPDAESIERSSVPFESRRGLLFLGNFRHEPNVAALEYLMRAIVPLLPPALLERHPISVVGTDLTEEVIGRCQARRAGVRLVGWVPSLDSYLMESRLMIAPLTYGAGTKRKLVQAAMAGLPSVTTTVGAEGLPLRPDLDILVADDAAAFAAAVVRAAEDRKLWEQLAAGASEAIRPAHEREAVRRRFNSVIDRLLA